MSHQIYSGNYISIKNEEVIKHYKRKKSFFVELETLTALSKSNLSVPQIIRHGSESNPFIAFKIIPGEAPKYNWPTAKLKSICNKLGRLVHSIHQNVHFLESCKHISTRNFEYILLKLEEIQVDSNKKGARKFLLSFQKEIENQNSWRLLHRDIRFENTIYSSNEKVIYLIDFEVAALGAFWGEFARLFLVEFASRDYLWQSFLEGYELPVSEWNDLKEISCIMFSIEMLHFLQSRPLQKNEKTLYNQLLSLLLKVC